MLAYNQPVWAIACTHDDCSNDSHMIAAISLPSLKSESGPLQNLVLQIQAIPFARISSNGAGTGKTARRYAKLHPKSRFHVTLETALGIEILGGFQPPDLRTGGENNRFSGCFASVTASEVESSQAL